MQHPPPRRHTPSVEDQTAAEPNQKDMTKSSYIQVLTSQISLTLLQAFRNLSRCAGGLRAISVLSGFFRVSLTSASLSEDLPSCSVYPSKLFCCCFVVVNNWMTRFCYWSHKAQEVCSALFSGGNCCCCYSFQYIFQTDKCEFGRAAKTR